MSMVLVPNIGISTSMSNTTQIRPQQFRNFMCVHWECALWQSDILVLTPAYLTLNRCAHNTSETSCVSTGNVRGVVLAPNIGLRTTISNTSQICPQQFRNFVRVHCECVWCYYQILVLEPPYPTLNKYAHSTSETSCVSTGNVRGARAKYWYQHQHIQHYTNTPTAVQKLHVCPLGMCVVLVPNIGLGTAISNTKLVRPQHFRNLMCVHWECAWCQYHILVLASPYPTLHKYAHSTSETSCVSTGNVRGASTIYWSQNHHIQH